MCLEKEELTNHMTVHCCWVSSLWHLSPPSHEGGLGFTFICPLKISSFIFREFHVIEVKCSVVLEISGWILQIVLCTRA